MSSLHGEYKKYSFVSRDKNDYKYIFTDGEFDKKGIKYPDKTIFYKSYTQLKNESPVGFIEYLYDENMREIKSVTIELEKEDIIRDMSNFGFSKPLLILDIEYKN